MAVFDNLVGDQTFRGTAAAYDQVDYNGELSDYTFTLNADGSLTVSHPTLGTDTLWDINGFWFRGEQRWYSVDDALALAGDADGTVDANGVIVGNAQDNVLVGTAGDDTFYGGRGDDRIDGNGGPYNQVDYDGALADYQVTRNTDGSLRVVSDVYGTDTLVDIDGLWFGGEAQWYSVDDAVAASGETPINVDEAGVLQGTNGNDTLTYAPGVNALYGGLGNDRLVGEADAYSQANYDGRSTDYRFTRNTDGTVTVSNPTWGTDTLVEIDGFWFSGERAWYALSDLLDGATPPDDDDGDDDDGDADGDPSDTGTLVDGVITGSNDVNDFLFGTDGNDAFAAGMGVDRIEGGAGQRDVLNVDGDVIEWTFGTNAAGETVMTHATWGENTLVGVELIFFGRSGDVLSVADAVSATRGLPEFRVDADNVLNGTNGDDDMRGGADGTLFYGGVGDDNFWGAPDSFDQVNYDGARSEYAITLNADGSVTVDHPVWGLDTLNDIDGLVFTGREPGADGAEVAPFEYVNVNDLFVENRVLINVVPEDVGDYG